MRTGRHHSAGRPCETIGHSRDADRLHIAVDAPLLDKTRDPHSLPPWAESCVEEGRFYAWPISGEIQPSSEETLQQCVHTTLRQLGMTRSERRMRMKTYRLITLFAAVLITVSLTRVLSHERVGEPQAQSPVVATANAP
jgi:hypothetical protein